MAFINGDVHFQVSCTDGLKVCTFVLSFDFSEEVFHRIALPKAKVRAGNKFRTYGFRGSLSLVFNELVDSKRCYSIWVMKEYGIVKSWTELFTVDLSGYISRVFGFGRMAMYYLRNNGEEMIKEMIQSSLHMTLRANKLRSWAFLGGQFIFVLITMWRTLFYSTNQMLYVPNG